MIPATQWWPNISLLGRDFKILLPCAIIQEFLESVPESQMLLLGGFLEVILEVYIAHIAHRKDRYNHPDKMGILVI